MNELRAIKLRDIKYSKEAKNLDQVFKGLSIEDLKKRLSAGKINKQEHLMMRHLREKNSESLNSFANNLAKLPPIFNSMNRDFACDFDDERREDIYEVLSMNNINRDKKENVEEKAYKRNHYVMLRK